METVTLTLVLLLSVASPFAFSQKQPGDVCTREDPFSTSYSPFHAKHHQAIDDVRGPTFGAEDPGDAGQDKAKNNLCSGGSPIEIAIYDLKDMQNAVDSSTWFMAIGTSIPAFRLHQRNKIAPGSGDIES
jgi:hypothetical protein